MSSFSVGVVVLMLIAAGSYLGYTKRLQWADDWEVHAVVADVHELNKGSKVRIAGVNVGRVTKVRHGPAGTSVVTMAISDHGRPLHEDATLTLRPRLFLEGDFFVDVRPGSPGARDLEEGDTIPIGQTASAVRIDSVLRILRSDVRESLRDGLDEYAAALDGGGAQALNRSFDTWAPAFLGTARTANALRGLRRDDLSAFLRETSRIAAGFAADEAALGRLVSGFSRTVAATADRRRQLTASIREFGVVAQTAPAALRDLERALPALRQLAIDLRPALRRASPALDDLQPVLAEVRGLVGPREIPRLARELTPALRSLRTLSPELGALLAPVRRVSECVSSNVVPVLNSRVDDGALSSGEEVWRELLRFNVALSGASQNFDGNGPDLRYSLGFGDQTVSIGSGPSTGDLFARTADPILGSRPQMPARRPPLRADAPCRGQQLPDLRTSASPRPLTRPAPPLDLTARQTRALRRLLHGRRSQK